MSPLLRYWFRDPAGPKAMMISGIDHTLMLAKVDSHVTCSCGWADPDKNTSSLGRVAWLEHITEVQGEIIEQLLKPKPPVGRGQFIEVQIQGDRRKR